VASRLATRVGGALLVLTAPLVGCEPTGAKAPAPLTPNGLRQVALGLCEDYPEESRSLAEARRDLGVLQRAGVGVLRVSIGWDGVEPEKDRYDFAFWDAFVDLAVREFGITLIPYVAYTPHWNSDGGPEDHWKTPPRDLQEFAEIMHLLAARYRGRVGSWELWNEPDNRDYWLGTPADYARLLAAGSQAVRAAAPEAKVVFGGIAGGVDFLRELFDEHGASQRVDVVNLHAYYETWNPNPLESISPYIAEAAAIVERHRGAQALWMAEVGYSNYRLTSAAAPLRGYEHTAEFQAVMLLRTTALVLSAPAVSLFAWYELKDPRPSDAMIGDDHNRHLGVTFADYRPKPAFAALGFSNRLFGAGFRSLDGELRVEAAPASLQLRGFLTSRSTVVLVAWFPTHPASELAGLAASRALFRLGVPYAARGLATVHDAQGRVRSTRKPREPFPGHSELELEVEVGDVLVVELPVNGGSSPRSAQ
jgi:hypothetical protein